MQEGRKEKNIEDSGKQKREKTETENCRLLQNPEAKQKKGYKRGFTFQNTRVYRTVRYTQYQGF